MSHPDADFLNAYLAPLKGATITDVRVGIEENGMLPNEAWPVLVVRTSTDSPVGEVDWEIEVSRDEEGNGPGFLFGLPFPEKKETAV